MGLRFSKALKIMENEGVFLVANTNKYKYYAVRSITNRVYDVIYDKQKDIYSCSCKNIRNISCSHIEAVILYEAKNEIC